MNDSLSMTGAIAIAHGSRRSALAAALIAPWYAVKTQTRWLLVVTLSVACIGALLIGVLVPTARGQLLACLAYAGGVGFAWAFGFSGLLLVARDGWRLAVPGVVRNATLSALLYAAITLALPVSLQAAFGWNVAPVALMVALAVAAGLAFVLLPRWIAMWMGFFPAMYGPLHDHGYLPSPLQPAFLHWGVALLLVLLVPAVWRWARLLRRGSDDASGWNSAMIFQLRQQAVTSSWAFDKQLFWRNTNSQHRHMDLRGIDATTPAKAITVALGGVFVPRTGLGILRRALAMLWPVLLFAAGMLLVNLGDQPPMRRLVEVGAIGGAMWGGLFGTSMAVFGLYGLLQRRWQTGAEPALLALLPGLDRQAPLHRSVARAAFTKPMLLCLALWALMVACEVPAHFGAAVVAATTAVVASMCLLTAGALLRVFAGRPLRGLVLGMMAIAVFVMMLLSLGFVIVVAVRHAALTLLAWGVVAAWSVLALGAAIFVLRAWRLFVARPNPFLAGAR